MLLQTSGLLFVQQLLAIYVFAQLDLPKDQDLYCAGCEAVINELHQRLSRRSEEPMEVTVVELLEDFCDQENFKTYEFIPPKMVKACQHLMDNHEEELERLLIYHYSKSIKTSAKNTLEREICHKQSEACVDEDKKKKRRPQTAKVVMDGEEKEIKFEQGQPIDFKEAKRPKRKGKKKSKTQEL